MPRNTMQPSGAINVYCDESCHLENDHQTAMVIGAVWCPAEKAREIAKRMREIKIAHRFKREFEIKWGKVSRDKASFYSAVLDYFFDDDDLHFRAIIIPDKSRIDHKRFRQTHDNWYYKIYFSMLKLILGPTNKYNIFIDIKDTCSGQKVARLHDALCNNVYDFRREIIARVQNVRSHEVQQVQMADLLVGIVSYANRNLSTSQAKLALVHRMRERSNYSLTKTTLIREDKVNLLRWEAKQEDQ